MPYDNETDRERRARTRLEAWPVQQFGQSADTSAFNGATACTHVCWQKIAYIWLGRKYSIDQISSFAGYYREKNTAGQPRGMNVGESVRLIARLNLPYVFKSTLDWEDIWQIVSTRGPVIYATRYGAQPDWRGYLYNGIRADGKPNGFAYKAGRTQLSGFENGAHAVIAASTRTLRDNSGHKVRTELVRQDPNHGSPSRPERPPYDLISKTQGSYEYRAHANLPNRGYIAFVPTRAL